MRIVKRFLSLPLSAQIEITDFCNHRCIHCYNLDSEIKNRPSRIVEDDIVLACVQKLIDNNIFNVIVTGGEPLLKKDLTKKIICLLKENNIRVSLNTNLTLVDDEFVQFLKEQKVGVVTSCPSGVASSYSKLVGIDNYSVFVDNLKKLVSNDVHFTVNMVVTKDNIHEIRTTAEYLNALGCKSFAATPMGLNVGYPRFDLLLNIDEVHTVIKELLWVQDNFKMDVDILEALPKCIFPTEVLCGTHSFLNRRCQAGRTTIAVSCNGDVRPCAHNPSSYGNILNEDLHHIWVKMGAWRSAQFIPEECKDCAWLNHCNGGCRTSAKVVNGEWNKKDIWFNGQPAILPHEFKLVEIELTNKTRLCFKENVRIRQDGEDAFVIYNMDDDVYFMVNQAFYEFIKQIKDKKEIVFEDIKNTEQNNGTVIEMCMFLINKKVLTIKTINE